VGDLDRVRIVQMLVFVASTPDFGQQSQVANAASELLIEVVGENGRHARTAIGVAGLPLNNTPVEIEMICTAVQRRTNHEDRICEPAPTGTRHPRRANDTSAPIVLADVMQDDIDRMQGFAAPSSSSRRRSPRTSAGQPSPVDGGYTVF